MQRGEQPIHEVRAHGDQSRHQRLAVFCPVQGETIEFGECERCAHAVGFELHARDGGAQGDLGTVRCRSEVENDPALLLSDSVGAIMSRNVECVNPSLPVRALLSLLEEGRFEGAPVVDAGGHLVGIVGKDDVIRAIHSGARLDGPSLDGEGGLDSFDPDDRPRGPLRVGDVMTRARVTLRERTAIHTAAAQLVEHKVHRAPVVDAHNRVIGIVTSLDLSSALARRGQPR